MAERHTPEEEFKEFKEGAEMAESLETPSPSPSLPPIRPDRPTYWTSLITKWVGLVVVIYEMVWDKLEHPYVMGIGVTMALGGKASDLLRRGGL